MNGTPHMDDDGFHSRLDALFDTQAPGLESPQLETRILRRLSLRRRVRMAFISVSALVGLAISVRSLSEARLPVFHSDPLLEATGNSISQYLSLALGSGLPGVVASCGVLTVLGLAFARFLEEV